MDPNPWDESWTRVENTVVRASDTGKLAPVATFCDPSDGHRNDSDRAILAAAAPDLYHALVMAREDLKLYAGVGEPPFLFSAIDAALAKARGEK